ncbi:MAG: sulfurtransferase TusA family protein [Candidatus Lokiarchaeota archaeon]|nr:sulfurtransferase TusA family protein [Candidatus Lokiarchaeota archaeon]
MSQKNITELDIKGKLCPMTFVYTKLALEKLKSGDTLNITLDYPPAVENIPENCKRQGLAKILDIKQLKDDIWSISLEKI